MGEGALWVRVLCLSSAARDPEQRALHPSLLSSAPKEPQEPPRQFLGSSRPGKRRGSQVQRPGLGQLTSILSSAPQEPKEPQEPTRSFAGTGALDLRQLSQSGSRLDPSTRLGEAG